MNIQEVKVAVGYIRVSTDEQVSGTSLGSQKTAIKEFAKRENITISNDNIYREEGVSAKLIDRPELARLLKYCADNKGKVTHCIVWKVDRLARRSEYHHMIKAQLAKFGVKLLSVTEPIGDDAMGSLVETMLAGFAQFDNDIRLLRTTTGMRTRTMQGGWPHDAPVGYIKWKTPSGITSVQPDNKENMADKVSEFLTEFSSGAYTVEQSRELAYEMGVRDRKGGRMRWQGTKNMLQNILYAGYIRTKYTEGDKIKGLHESLIPISVYNKNQSILDGNTTNYSKNAELEWPLRGGFIKHTCGKPMTGGVTTNRPSSGSRYSCTTCRAKTLGSPVSVQKEVVHAQFVELLESIAPSDAVQKLFKEVVLRVWNVEFKDAIEVSGRVDAELTALKSKKSRILDLYIDNKITEQDKREKLLELDTQANKLELQRIDSDLYVSEKEQIIDSALLFMSEPSTFWHLSSLALKKRVQDVIFPDGLTYDCSDGFRTPILSKSYLLIKKIASEDANNSTLVAPTRIELVTSSL